MTTLAPTHSIEALVSSGAVNGVDVAADGANVVFASSEGGRFKLYIMPVDGSRVPRLLDTGRSRDSA